MLETLKAHVLHLLVIGYASALPYLNAKFGLHMTDNHLHGIQALCAILLGKLWHTGVVQAKVGTFLSTSAKVASVLLLAFTMNGWAAIKADIAALTPAQIQTDASVGIQTALTGWAMADPSRQAAIMSDAQLVSNIITNQLLPAITGAPVGTVLNGALNQACLSLSKQIVGMKNGPLIVSEIRLAVTLAGGALGTTATPTLPMTAATQAKAVAFLTGTAQGLSGFAGPGK